MKNKINKLLILLLTAAFTFLFASVAYASSDHATGTRNVDEMIEINGEIEDIQFKSNKSHAKLKIKLNTKEKTDKGIILNYQLLRLNDRNQLETIDEKEINQKISGNGKNIKIDLRNLDDGQYEIKLNAVSVQNQYESWGAIENIYFTVNNDIKVMENKWDELPNANQPAVNEQGEYSGSTLQQ